MSLSKYVDINGERNHGSKTFRLDTCIEQTHAVSGGGGEKMY